MYTHPTFTDGLELHKGSYRIVRQKECLILIGSTYVYWRSKDETISTTAIRRETLLKQGITERHGQLRILTTTNGKQVLVVSVRRTAAHTVELRLHLQAVRVMPATIPHIIFALKLM